MSGVRRLTRPGVSVVDMPSRDFAPRAVGTGLPTKIEAHVFRRNQLTANEMDFIRGKECLDRAAKL